MAKNKVVVIDTETTGLCPGTDEILQISAIDGNGQVLIDRYIRPVQMKTWPDAQEVHGISPEDVAGCQTLDEMREYIQSVLNGAEMFVTYNGQFDFSFLRAAGFIVPDVPHVDVMRMFAPVYGEWSSRYGSYKWQKLETCARYYGYEFKAHNSLEDVKATLYCYRKMTV